METNRRAFLGSVGVGAVALLGGCLDGFDGSGGGTPDGATGSGDDGRTGDGSAGSDSPSDGTKDESGAADATTRGESDGDGSRSNSGNNDSGNQNERDHPVPVNVWNRNDEERQLGVEVARSGESILTRELTVAAHGTKLVEDAFFVEEGERATYTVTLRRVGSELGSKAVRTADHPGLHEVRVAVKERSVTEWEIATHE